MIESILESIKRPLNIEESETNFDDELEMHINSAFSQLYQIGVAPQSGFEISGKETKWSDYLGDIKDVAHVRTYIYYQVKLDFDAPATSFALTAAQERLKKLEWLLQTLELTFNPNAYVSPSSISGEASEPPTVWTIDESQPLPEEMKVGEVGFDPKTGNLVRKI